MTTNATDTPAVDIDLSKMPNRNFRIPWHFLEALGRQGALVDRNDSEVLRMILIGRLPDFVESGILCAKCEQVDCVDMTHDPAHAALRKEVFEAHEEAERRKPQG